MNKSVNNTNEPEPANPLSRSRIAVFCLSLVVMSVITAWPHTFGSSTETMNHHAAMLTMLGMCLGFVYGIGFTPRQSWLRVLYCAPMALGLMLTGFVMMLF